MTVARAFAVGLLSLALASCDSNDSSPTAPAQLPTALSVAAVSLYDGSPESLAPQPGASDARFNLTVEVRAESVTNLREVGFKFRYPEKLLRYAGFDCGEFLDRTAVIGPWADCVSSVGPAHYDGSTALDRDNPGLLEISLRDHAPSLPAPSGSGTLIKIYFDAVAPGDGRAVLEQIEAISSSGKRETKTTLHGFDLLIAVR